jgi:hypothetical protein
LALQRLHHLRPGERRAVDDQRSVEEVLLDTRDQCNNAGLLDASVLICHD